MVDINKLYEPIKRYHDRNSDGNLLSAASAVAATSADSTKLGSQLISSPNVSKLIEALGKSNQNRDNTKLEDAIINKWKKDDTFITRLDTDLAKGDNYQKLLNQIKSNPDVVINKIIPQYNEGTNLTNIITSSMPSQPAKAVGDTKQQTRAEPITVKTKDREIKHSNKPDSIASGGAAGRGVERNANAAVENTPVPPEVAAAIQSGIFESFATKSDAEIIKSINPDLTKGITNGFADQALKLGVPKEFTDSFRQRMAQDGKLRGEFEENLKRNPELVRQMAKSMKDGGEMPPQMKEIAKKTMMDVMENPEQLAKDDFAKRMTQGLQAKNAGGMNMNNMLGGMGGLGGIFSGMGDMGGMFAGIGAFFQKIMDSLGGLFKEVQGGEWMSRGNSGRNFLQRFSDVISDTPARLASEKDAVQKMVIHPAIDKDGIHYTHLSPVLNKDGKPVIGDDGKPLTRIENNTIEITTISGNTMKVLPATGLTAVRDKQNNYHMMVVTDAKVDANGIRTPESVTQVVLTPEEYVKYNEQMKKYGDPSMPPPQYAMADNNVKNIPNAAAQKDGPNITHLDENGRTVELRTIREPEKVEVIPLAAANNPNLKIQA